MADHLRVTIPEEKMSKTAQRGCETPLITFYIRAIQSIGKQLESICTAIKTVGELGKPNGRHGNAPNGQWCRSLQVQTWDLERS
jgi:hypothetical protein